MRDCLDGVLEAWRLPPEVSLSVWADANYVLSPETSAVPGRWTCLPYQRAWLNAVTDDSVEKISIMKSSRVGYSLCLSAVIGYHMAADPTSILICQPTLADAIGFSKESITPLLRDNPILARLGVRDDDAGDESTTLLHRSFPGGILSLCGANSGAGFRRISRRVILIDECDAYPSSAGVEGDPIALAIRRSEAFHNRKIVCGSTPLVSGSSRIEELYNAGDRRKFFLPCPHCQHYDELVFNPGDKTGHYMAWDDGKPETAHFVCRNCGCAITEEHKLAMLERGEWRAEAEFRGHASFSIWAAYSTSPGASWATIAAEFLEARTRPETLRAFVNLVLGQTWKERSQTADWQRLFDRRESYQVGTCPIDPWRITAGCDVQRDRLVVEIVAWAPNKESWSIDALELFGDTVLESTWAQLDELLNREFMTPNGTSRRIDMLAVDAGFATQTVYGWTRRYPLSRVIACKGSATATALFSPPKKVDVTTAGKTARRGHRVWMTSPDVAKVELMGWLGLRRDENGEYPSGYLHFPEHPAEFFKQLCGEQLVTVTNKRTRRQAHEWQPVPGRENHWLDSRILCRVAAAVLGIDRLPASQQVRSTAKPTATAPATNPPPAPPPVPAPYPAPPRQSWLNGGRSPRNWLGGRRWR